MLFYKKNHIDRKEGLDNEDWSEIYNLDDPNQIYDMMLEKYSHHYHLNKTVKSVSRRSNRFGREPWMTQEILADIRRRDRLVRDKNRREDYRKLRNDIVKRIRKAEKDYLRTQVDSSVGNIKQHWNIIKKVTYSTGYPPHSAEQRHKHDKKYSAKRNLEAEITMIIKN